MNKKFITISCLFYLIFIVSCMAQPNAVLTEPKINKEEVRKDENLTEKKIETSIINRTVKIAAKEDFIIVHNKKYPASKLLNSFYQSRKFNLAWFKSNLEPRKAFFTYLKLLKNSDYEGLNPDFYYFQDIEENILELQNLSGNDLILRVIQIDLLVSNSNLQYFSDLLFGRYELGPNFSELSYSEPYINLVSVINKSIRTNNFNGALKLILPESKVYYSLREALREYEQINVNGGWQPVPPGPTLKKGARNARIVFLKHRLYASGDLKLYANQNPEQYLNDNFFDDQLFAAVKEFQKRHGLKQDGEVGNNTLSSLNIPLDYKLTSIKINLDLWRKLPKNLGEKYILVNVPAFKLYGVENNQKALDMRVIVGRLDWNTPVFSEYMEYVVINPFWNIPSSIFVDEVLPEIKKDPEYLKKKNIELVSLSDASVGDTDYVNWYEVDPNNFNYRLRQQPGAANPLGKLKFMLPNKHSVYLHDTPMKSLFNRTNRRFSHGCIRVEHPLDLADFVFNDDSNWDAQKVQNAINSGVSNNVYLKQPIPVHILYFTVWAEDDGSIHFRDDVYNFFGGNAGSGAKTI